MILWWRGGTGITPALLGAFFRKCATTAGGVSSFASGMLATLIWEFGNQLFDIPTVYPALGVSLLCLILGSLITEKPSAEKWKPFYS
jgi:Na+/proline symporter